jgi:cation diffusion facilitator family transporter
LDWGLGLSLFSSALNGVLAWIMFRASREHRSLALQADARHLVTDVWTSVGVVVGLVAVDLTGWLWLDAAVAMLVGLNILREGVHLVWQASQGLMDEAVEPETQEKIQQTLLQFTNQDVYFDHLISRKAGQRCHVDMHMHLPAEWTLGQAAAQRLALEQALMQVVPGLRASIQLLPTGVEAHFDDPKDL